MSSTNPIVAAIATIAKPTAVALVTGIPVGGSAPSNTANPVPNTWQTTSPPILDPDGIQVHGFRMDPATVKLSAATIIEDSLSGAMTLAEIAVEKLHKGGPTDPDFLILFKNATYYDAVLSVFQRIAALMPLRMARNPPLGNVTLSKITSGNHPANAKGAFSESVTTIELYNHYWEKSYDLPAKGQRPPPGAFGQWLDEVLPPAQPKNPLAAVYGSRGLILLHEMIHLISVGMPAIKAICKRCESLVMKPLDHVGDVRFGDFYMASANDKGIFAKILPPNPAHQVTDTEKRSEYAYGLTFTRFLASLDNGDMAAALNADNYAVFASVSYYKAFQGP